MNHQTFSGFHNITQVTILSRFFPLFLQETTIRDSQLANEAFQMTLEAGSEYVSYSQQLLNDIGVGPRCVIDFMK